MIRASCFNHFEGITEIHESMFLSERTYNWGYLLIGTFFFFHNIQDTSALNRRDDNNNNNSNHTARAKRNRDSFEPITEEGEEDDQPQVQEYQDNPTNERSGMLFSI